MSVWSRFTNLFHDDRLTRELDEELESHLAEAIESGRASHEAHRAFGSPLRQREASRDLKLIGWLDSLRADSIFGCRQLIKNKVASASAILSLALALGACTAAFRLIDAVLLRPLPVAAPDQLYALSRQGMGFDGKPASFDGWAYPDFQLMRDAVQQEAQLLALSYSDRTDLTYASDQEMEKAQVEYVSGSMFPSFAIRPSAGRLFTEDDDRKPAAHPYAVISHNYWERRFGADSKVIGRSFRLGDSIFEVIGVAEAPFAGTEPGVVTDIFLPAMMHPSVTRDDSTWHRTLVRMQPGASLEAVRAKLDATSRAFEQQRLSRVTGKSKRLLDVLQSQTVVMLPAANGVSGFQQEFRRSLIALGVLVALVLLIACANIANLMMVQASARAREMALRLSIGAGRRRLVQMLLVESGWLAALAATLGALFAWWSTPFVVSLINPPDNPVQLILPWDWRVLRFGLALTFGVTFLCGLSPALRASSLQPVSALKGGTNPHSRRRLMHVLIAMQVAFSVVVLFASGLFTASFRELAHRPLGFSAERILTLDTIAAQAQPATTWDQVAERLRATPGVDQVTLSARPLLGSDSWNSFIAVNGEPPSPVLAFFLTVSAGWIDNMKLPLIDGRDLRPNETSPGAAIVNQAFAKQYFGGESPVGRTFERGPRQHQVVGLVGDAPYRNLREPILPVAYIPFHEVDANGAAILVKRMTYIVRTTAANPLSMAVTLRQAISHARADFRVSNVRSQVDINESHTVRERLLALLAFFFAAVALLLAGIGLYGVLDYSVLQRRREFGIRLAIGAPAYNIAGLVGLEVLAVVSVGVLLGLGSGFLSARYVESLLYRVRVTDVAMLAAPALAIFTVAALAALRPVLHALRIDPVEMLRGE